MCRTLGALAEKGHAFAKALHYKELEYATSPDTAVEALISINNQLRQPEAAIGILTLAQTQLHMELKVPHPSHAPVLPESDLSSSAALFMTAAHSVSYTDSTKQHLTCLAADFSVILTSLATVEPDAQEGGAHAYWVTPAFFDFPNSQKASHKCLLPLSGIVSPLQR